MFNSNNGGSSLFNGGLSTSTPTSTPTQSNNVFQPRAKSVGGLFGGANMSHLNAVSTPSPSGGLSDPKIGTNQSQNSNNALFGNSNQTSNNGNSLFGNNAGSSVNNSLGSNTGLPLTGLSTSNVNGGSGMFSKPTLGASSTGTGSLFSNGNGSSQLTSSSGVLFGNSNSNTIGSNTEKSSIGGGFGTTSSKGLFGNSTSATDPNAANSGGLFNSKPSLSTSNSLFGNKTTSGGLFGNNNSNNNTSSSTGLFGNSSISSGSGINFSNPLSNSKPSNFLAGSQTGPNQQNIASLSVNPYGLQIGPLPSSVTNMPDSITASFKKSSKLHDDLTSTEKRRTFSTSSSGSMAPTNIQGQGTLISKLSSRLSTVKGSESIQGLFSPARKTFTGREGLNSKTSKETFLENKSKQVRGDDLNPLMKRTDVSEIRKLKIDTGRSAAKKMKLLSGGVATTKIRLLGEHQQEGDSKSDLDAESNMDGNSAPDIEIEAIADESKERKVDKKSKEYWCSPSAEQLLKLPFKQLNAIPNFVIGRKGYGTISFDYDVDLSEFVEDFEGSLFDNLVIFNGNQTVEVYPDESSKPPVGYGLNVPATITLEQVYPIDRKTKKPIKDNSKLIEVQLFVKKLKKLKGMEFVSYNPFGGIWTFRVKHFSIWGLIDDEDVEVDEQEAEEALHQEIRERKIAIPRMKRERIETNSDLNNDVGEVTTIRPNGFSSFTGVNDRELVPIQDLSDYPESSTDYGMHDLVEEKNYEPSNVDVEDFQALEAHPVLEVSNSWIEQLKMAGLPYNSIFSSKTSEVSDRLELKRIGGSSSLFSDLDNTLNQHKKIIKELRLEGRCNFAKFNTDTTILLRSGKSISGALITSLESTLKNQRIPVSQTFSQNLMSFDVQTRPKNGYPVVKEFPLTFSEIAQTISRTDPECKIWDLTSILFDSISLPYETESHDVSLVLIKKERYKNLCKWLKDEVSAKILAKIDLATSSNEKIYLMLLMNDIIGATKLAIDSENSHLAALIAMLGSNDPHVRRLSSEQLEKWKSINSKVDRFVVKVYQLLSGRLFGASVSVDFSKELSWLECLAISLFFGEIDEHSLEELVSDFLENHGNSMTIPLEHSIIVDILRCFGGKNTSSAIFKHTGFAKDNLDFRFQWFFTQILKSKGQNILPGKVQDYLTLQYVEQLKIEQLFNEALLTLLFVQDDEVAKQQIDSLVTSLIEFFATSTNKGVVSKLRVPSKLLCEALAMHAKYRNDFTTEVRHLLDGKLFDAAEEVMLSKVAPGLILKSVNGNLRDTSLRELKSLLERFPSHQMHNWAAGLEVFGNYLSYVEGTNDEEVQEKLLSGLPALYATHRHIKDITICCCIMSHNLCHGILKSHKNDIAVQIPKDKLLALPLGQPERVYLATVLSAI